MATPGYCPILQFLFSQLQSSDLVTRQHTGCYLCCICTMTAHSCGFTETALFLGSNTFSIIPLASCVVSSLSKLVRPHADGCTSVGHICGYEYVFRQRSVQISASTFSSVIFLLNCAWLSYIMWAPWNPSPPSPMTVTNKPT